MDIMITKIGRTVPVNWNLFDDDARGNAIVVGLGRILNDSVAGVKRDNFDSDDEFVAACLTKIETRLVNLANADRRTARTIKTVVREMTPDEMKAALESAGFLVA